MAATSNSNQEDFTGLKNTNRINLCVKIVVSAIVLAASLYVILSQKFPDDYNKWAFGMTGLVVGYWLR
jgi:hypothetical protein